MKLRLFPLAILTVGTLILGARSARAQYQMERLSRGVIAVRSSSTQVYVGWRLFGNDPAGVAFNLYRSAGGGAPVLLNGSPLTATTNFLDIAHLLKTTNSLTRLEKIQMTGSS